jgi:hypothetical protein
MINRLFFGVVCGLISLGARAAIDRVSAAPTVNEQHATAGDGRSVLDEYRGYILDGGGYDWDGNPTINAYVVYEGGHIRLNPAYKELLVEVDAMTGIANLPAAEPDRRNTIKGWMNVVARGVSQRVDGAGFRMFYVLDDLATPFRASFPAMDGPGSLQEYTTQQWSLGNGTQGGGFDTNSTYHFTHLQLVSRLSAPPNDWGTAGQTFPTSTHQTTYAVDTGYAYCGPGADGILGTGDDVGWWGHPVTFNMYSASYISHELHHTYAWNCGDDFPTGGHINDPNGDGFANEDGNHGHASDYDYIFYNYNAGTKLEPDGITPYTAYTHLDYTQIKYGRGTTRFITIL